jgi:hypothetical protein
MGIKVYNYLIFKILKFKLIVRIGWLNLNFTVHNILN